MNGNIITETKENITDAGVKKSNVKLINAGTTLLSFKLSIGKTAIAGKNLYTNEAIAGLCLENEEKVLNKYLFDLFNSKFIDLEKGGFNAFGKSLNSEFLRNEVKIPLPPKNIQEKIVSEIEVLEKEEQEKKEKVGVLKSEIVELFENSLNGDVKNYRLSDDSIFEIGIGKRLLKDEILSNGKIPVYSANVFEPFGFINKNLLNDFSRDSVLWGIDGDWMVNYLSKNIDFYPTDHCGYLRIKDNQLNEKFVAYFLEKEGKKFGFSRTNRASIDRIQNIKIPLPSLEIQKQIVSQIEKVENEIEILKNDLKTIPEKKKEVLKKYL
ncbi:restriction endonuclease subunit S [Candidatus Gracilibacteria bacterium]|nr:restriction endonuclease subunit S [Candidatus Gracilibacteria bacterium]